MRYKAIVTDRNDPLQLGRIKVRCQQLVGGDQELPIWIAPELPFRDKSGAGFWFVPGIDTVVDLIEIEDGRSLGEYSEAFLDNAQFRYRPGEFSQLTPPANIWRENYPDRYGWNTPAGHVLYFDDVDRVVALIHSSGDAWIKFESDGKVKIKGAEIWIDENADQALVRGDVLNTFLTDLRTWLIAHIHSGVTTGPGSTGTPTVTPPALPSDLLSDDHRVK